MALSRVRRTGRANPELAVAKWKARGVNTLVAVAKWMLDIVYMFFAVRAVYRMGTARTLLASLLLVLGYFLIYILTLVVTVVAALIVVAKS